MEACSCGEGVIRLQEYGRCVTDQISAENAEHLRTHFSTCLTISPAWGQDGAYELMARAHIGTIVLDGLSIVILPKVPIDNLFYMLTYAYDLPKFRDEQDWQAMSDNLFEFVVQIFVSQVGQLARQGLHRAYLEQNDNSSYLRGRLLLSTHLRQNVVAPHRFYQRETIYSAELLENHILKYTLWYLSRIGEFDISLRQQIKRTLSAFAHVSLREVAALDCGAVVYNRLNQSYHTPIHLAQLLLQNLSLEGREGKRPFAAFLLPMYQVFELYVARFLAEHLAKHPSLSVDIQQSIWLDVGEKEKGIPDIVIKRNGKPLLVIDTKYKRFQKAPSKADRNQMFMYCHALDVAKGLLLYAGETEDEYTAVYPPKVLTAKTLPLSGSPNQLATVTKQLIAHLEKATNE